MLERAGMETDRNTGMLETKWQFGRRRAMPHHFIGNIPTYEPFWHAVALSLPEKCERAASHSLVTIKEFGFLDIDHGMRHQSYVKPTLVFKLDGVLSLSSTNCAVAAIFWLIASRSCRAKMDTTAQEIESRHLYLNRDPYLHPQRPRNPHDCSEGRIAVLGQCLVKPIPGHAGLTSQPAHVSRTRDVVEGRTNQAAVTRILLGTRFQVQAHVFPVTQILYSIPPRECFGHVCLHSFASRLARAISRL